MAHCLIKKERYIFIHFPERKKLTTIKSNDENRSMCCCPDFLKNHFYSIAKISSWMASKLDPKSATQLQWFHGSVTGWRWLRLWQLLWTRRCRETWRNWWNSWFYIGKRGKNDPSQGRTLRLFGFGDFGTLAGRSRMETAYGSGVARCRNWLSVALFPWQQKGMVGIGSCLELTTF